VDEFICISCWKEFTLAHDEVVRQQGKVACPFCGYILQVDASERSDKNLDTENGIELEEASLDTAAAASNLSEVIDWKVFSGEPDSGSPPVAGMKGSDDTADEFLDDPTPPDGTPMELPPEVHPVGEETLDEDVGFDDPAAHEKTPFEPVDTPAILRDTAETDFPDEPIEWRLKTSSGLTFRFTDPDALLGWKKKINIYREMHVSPDGENWVDYVVFVKRFESCEDARRAFIRAGKTTEELEAPEFPPKSDTAITVPQSREEAASGAGSEEDAESSVPTTQFTFRVEDKRGSRGKQVLLLAVGLALGVGAAWLALTYLQVF